MTITRFEGGADAIKALRDLEPKLKRETRANIRNAAKPLQSAIQSLIPSDTPMSGWTSGRYAFDGGAAKKGVKIQIKTTGRKKAATWDLVTIKQTNAGGAVFDMAGKRSGGNGTGVQFIANLRNRNGGASRSMWRGAEGQLPAIRKNVEAAVMKAALVTNTRLRRR